MSVNPSGERLTARSFRATPGSAFPADARINVISFMCRKRPPAAAIVAAMNGSSELPSELPLTRARRRTRFGLK